MVGSCLSRTFGALAEREAFYEKCWLALLLLLLAGPASAQQTAPELQFDSVPDLLMLPPEGISAKCPVSP
jgi:hypothetical protein